MADLDLLDLDDMFNDDGDQLFEGLDIELDGMGDIISNEKKEKPPPVAAAPPPAAAARRAGGPRTKRTNPMLEKAAEEDDDGTTPKRRKTKRKSKAPSAFDDDEFIVDEQPKKKRKAALKAKKATEPITKTKRKKKSETEVTTPPPAASPALPPPPTVLAASTSMASKAKSSGPTVSVAAAGQFGGRVKRGSASSMGGSTKVKRRLKKAATAAAAAGGETETPGGIAVAPKPDKPDTIKPPKPEPTFGGLAPSRQLFYPFLESVPPEPTMQKRKAYPVLDRINSALTSQIASSPNATQQPPTQPPRPGVPTEESAIFKLMLETYEGNDKDKQAFTAEKRAALLKGIPVMRDMIHGLDKPRLVGDVFSMCWLLTRQYNFIKQSLDNMKNWCKDEFNEEDYSATYDPPVEKPKHSKWKSPVVKLKISFNGYKEPKGTPPLIGVLPPIVVDAASVSRASFAITAAAVAEAKLKAAESKRSAIPTVKTTAVTATKTKKKKEKASGKPTKAKTLVVATATAPAVVPTSVVARTYTGSSPQARRQQIMEKVAKLALQLENAQQTEHTIGKLDPIPEEDPPLHTARMWDFLQKAGFYKHPPSKRLGLRSPEVNPRGVFLPVPTKIRGRESKEDKFSQDSLFDRLQSLLVEENIDDNENEDSDSDDDSLDFLEDDDDDDDGFDFKRAEEDTDENDDRNVGLADLSKLSIEERTFIQLASAGLIRKSLFPVVELAVSSDDEDEDENDEVENDMVNVIGKMSSDLSAITAMNNARVSYLETATAGPDLLYKKQIEEEQAALIAKCQNLIKRNREKAKKAKQKKDDNLNLPW